MRMILRKAMTCLVLMAALASPAEAAQLSERTFRTAEECMNAISQQADVGDVYQWSCSKSGEGSWVAKSEGGGELDSPGPLLPSGGFPFGTFIVFGLIWIGIPLILATALASSRDESVGMAIVLTFVLGWIGLAIVYFGQKRSSEAVSGLLERHGRPAGPEPVVDDPGERLKRLEQLRDEGLISDAEFSQRRQEVISTL